MIPVWECFLHLNARRQNGFGLNPISLEAISIFLDRRFPWLGNDGWWEYYDMICMLDGEYMKLHAEETKS